MDSEALARAVMGGSGRRVTRRGWWAARCATSCWAGSRRISISPRTRGPTASWTCFPMRAWWARSSAWCWCATAARRWKWPLFAATTLYADGRRPSEVRFETDPREDVLRRDFTINGLMMDPDTGRGARLRGRPRGSRSPAGARDRRPRTRDSRKTICGCCARCASPRGSGSRSSPPPWRPSRRHHALIRTVSAERVRDELVRILTEGGARRGFELLDSTGLLEDLLPEVAAMKGVQQPPEYHPEGDVWVHTLLLLEQLERPTATLAMGALLHDVGKPPTFRVAERIRFDGHVEEGVRLAQGILDRLRFSRHEAEQVLALVANHMRFKDVLQMKESTLKRFLRLPAFEEHLELHRLDALSSNRRLDSYEFVRGKLAGFSAGAPQAAAPADGRGPDRRRIPARSALHGNTDGRRRRPARRPRPGQGRGPAPGRGAIPRRASKLQANFEIDLPVTLLFGAGGVQQGRPREHSRTRSGDVVVREA